MPATTARSSAIAAFLRPPTLTPRRRAMWTSAILSCPPALDRDEGCRPGYRHVRDPQEEQEAGQSRRCKQPETDNHAFLSRLPSGAAPSLPEGLKSEFSSVEAL